MSEWLSADEAAAYLKVHRKTLYRYVRFGSLRQHRRGGTGHPRFLRKELDAFLRGETAEATEQGVRAHTHPDHGGGGALRFGAGIEMAPARRADTLREVLERLDRLAEAIAELRQVVVDLVAEADEEEP